MAFIGILGFVGFAIDTGIIYLHRVWLGQAVDSATLAAAYELPNVNAACARAVEYLRTNGYEAGPDFSFQIIFPSEPDAAVPPGDPGQFTIDSQVDHIQTPGNCASLSVPAAHQDVHYHVGVTGSQTVPVIFMSLLGFDTVGVGAPGMAERSAHYLYDVALVLDRSGSMRFDSCEWTRPDDEYGCQNHYGPCSIPFYSENFESYADNIELEAGGWTINSSANLITSGGHGNSKAVELVRIGSGYPQGEIYRTVNTVNPDPEDTTGYKDVVLSFWALNKGLGSSAYMEVYWRPYASVGWSQIARYSGSQLSSVNWTRYYTIVLPSSASENPNFQIRFTTYGAATGKGFVLDDVELMSCPQREGPWIWYRADDWHGCWTAYGHALDCHTLAPQMMIPAVSSSSPTVQMMEQPMLDVLLGAETFIQILDSHRLPGEPRQYMVGLSSFAERADKLHDLTIDYESVRDTLFTSIRGFGGTNLGGGMHVGTSILGDGRADSAHFMILLTDGWPNYYDYPYSNPTSFGRACGTNDPCTASLQYIDAQIAAAVNQNVTIFTIGLGEDLVTRTFNASSAYGSGWENCTGQMLLERIAGATGGIAYHAPTTEQLEKIFTWIAEAIFVRLTG